MQPSNAYVPITFKSKVTFISTETDPEQLRNLVTRPLLKNELKTQPKFLPGKKNIGSLIFFIFESFFGVEFN